MLGISWFDSVSSEHLAAAEDREIRAWRSVAQDEEITHDTPVRGGTSFIDLRRRPTPPQATVQYQPEPVEPGDEKSDGPAPDVPMNGTPDRTFETPGEILPEPTLQSPQWSEPNAPTAQEDLRHHKNNQLGIWIPGGTINSKSPR